MSGGESSRGATKRSIKQQMAAEAAAIASLVLIAGRYGYGKSLRILPWLDRRKNSVRYPKQKETRWLGLLGASNYFEGARVRVFMYPSNI